MATVAKLTQDGELQLAGSINTRLPLVTDGLVAHYPMDGSTKGIADFNKLDYSTWNIGTTGSQTGFNQNGTSAENSIVEDTGPFGESQAIWQALGNDSTSNADGGWNGSTFPVDRTKTYRHSVWIRRKVAGNGTGYFGCKGGQVYNIAGNSSNGNPYFWAAGISGSDWRLYVAYVYPSDIGNSVPANDGGIYYLNGSKKQAIGSFKFSPTATTNNHRTYLYYSTNAATNQQWAYPRVDIVDGTEPSLEDLLSGEGNVTNPQTDTATTITNDYVGIEESTTNLVDMSTTAFSAWSGLTGSSVYYNSHEQRRGVRLITLTSGGVNWYNSGGQKAVSSSTVYTVSAKIRYTGGTPHGNLFYIRQYNAAGAQTSEGGKYSSSYQHAIGDGWYKAYRTFTTDGTAVKALVQGYEYSAGRKIWIEDVQLEQKSFATEYVDGSRTSSGSITIPTEIGTGDFTITGTFTPNADSDALPNSSYFLNLGSGFILRTYYSGGGVPYIDGNSIAGAGGNNVHINYNTLAGDTVNYVIKRSGTKFTWRMLDSRQDTTWTKVHDNVPLKNVSSISLNGSWGGTHKNLSIYNRALTDAEVLKNVKGTHSITSTGLISKYPIVSEALRPSGSDYFPLGSDGKDYYKSVEPITDNNIAYVGGARVGAGTTNLVNSSVTLTPYTPYNVINERAVGYVKLTMQSAAQYLTIHIGGSYVGKTLTFTGRLFKNGMPHVLTQGVSSTYQPTATTYEMNPTTGEFKIVQPYTSTNPWLFHTAAGTSSGDVIEIFDWQVEEAEFPSPFVDGTRGVSKLYLPVVHAQNTSFVLNVFAKGFRSDANVDIFCDDTDRWNGQLRSGGANSVELLVRTNLRAATGNKYATGVPFNHLEWNMFTLVSVAGIGAKVYVNGKLSGTFNGYYPEYTSISIGRNGMGDAAVKDSLLRDFTSYTGTMTDTEIEALFKTKMKATPSGLYLQSGITSGISL